MELTTVLAICIIAAFICLMLSSYKPEYAAVIALIAGAYVFLLLLKGVIPTVKGLSAIISGAGLSSEYLKTALKALGVCYITQFAADLCRDFGQSALAGKAELAGKCAVFLLSVPLLSSIVEIAAKLIGGV